MPARLLYLDGQGQNASVEIPETTPVFLGRGADCIVRTDDAMVSRKNCRISANGGRFFVEDLGSGNGTFINDQRIHQKRQLAHSDVIRCGMLQVRFVEAPAEPTPAPKPVSTTQELDVEELQPADLQSQPDLADAAAIASLTEDRDQLQKTLDESSAELQALRARLEGTEGELGRLRGDVAGGRDELARVKRDAARDKEELHAVNRRAAELVTDLEGLRGEGAGLRAKLDELTEELAARDRQLGRAHEEIQAAKKSIEELRTKQAELQKTKDEGWRELNQHLAQVENLREVISEQERILEERRVGLISLEAAAKDLRAEKERLLRELVDARNQRDQMRDELNRAGSKLEGFEEEQRRQARAVSEGVAGSGEEVARLSRELRELKVELKKQESEVPRLIEQLERAEVARARSLDDKARLDVELAQLVEDKRTAEAARARAEEGKARAEALMQGLEADKQAAGAARDATLATTEELRRSLARAERRIAELEKQAAVAVIAMQQTASGGTIPEEVTRPDGLALAAIAAPVAAGGDDAAARLRSRAQEVYEGINEALSELRTMIITAKGLFGEVGPMVADEDARRALAEALVNSMERTEDAKGLLRSLKELAQG